MGVARRSPLLSSHSRTAVSTWQTTARMATSTPAQAVLTRGPWR